MKLLDRVAEAYYGGMGDRFARKTRERIHWICSKVQGKHVLDVGCSQGITEILLAREGKQVVGIDIEEEAISYAKNAITNESDAVKHSVEYRACSIFEFESEYEFDTVILAEVIEHFSSPKVLLEEVFNLLTENGTLIITVPFGINDYIDHKKTYYLFNLLNEVETYFKVTEVKFFGKWLGLVTHKHAHKDTSRLFTRELVQQLEDSFYVIERALIDDSETKVNHIKKLNSQLDEKRTLIDKISQENEHLKRVHVDDSETKVSQINELNSQLDEKRALIYKISQENEHLKRVHVDDSETKVSQINELNSQLDEKRTLTNQINQENLQLKQTNEDLKTQYGEIADRLKQDYVERSEVELEISKYKQKIAEMEQTIESKNKEILKRLDSEESTLKQYKDAIFEYNQLEAKYANISKKYELLSNAKLGRLTLKYWKFRNRIPQDF